MKIEEFDYHLPKALIAQYPSAERGESRLMVVDRERRTLEHRFFNEILHYLRPEDLLVANDTRVLPARLIGRKETGGKCEVLLLPRWNGSRGEWKALIKGITGPAKGVRISFGQGIEAEIREVKAGKATLQFPDHEDVLDMIKKIGHIPLPPYIKRPDEPPDRVRYQTVFAERDGSIAAPTAGLHFTRELLHSIREAGIGVTTLTLHVGPGTFSPVKIEDIDAHSMEAEWTEIPDGTCRLIEQTKRRGKRVIAVGTTTTRAIESNSDPEGRLSTGQGFSSLFIRPPYRFRVIDGLLTNFHLPRSTLLMLVSAFAGRNLLLEAYREAVKENYRFYSYGDAMLIL